MYITARGTTQCWTEPHIRIRFFPSRITQPSWRGATGASTPEGAQVPVSIAACPGSTPGAFSGQLSPTPAAECVAARAKHTGPGLNCYSGKLIMSRFGCVCASCSYSFGLPYSSHFPGTSVSLGPNQRKKGCFGWVFFLIATLIYPIHMLLHESK